MILTLIPKSDRNSNPWSGGMTSDVLLFPSQTTASAKDYLFRISIASITEKHTKFSDFTGFHRIHLLLSGASKLTINGQMYALSGSFLAQSFDGGANCECELYSDSAVAMNITHRIGVQVKVAAPLLTESVLLAATAETALLYDLFYCASGAALLKLSTEASPVKLDQDDALVIQRNIGEPEVSLKLQGSAELIHVQLKVPR